MDDTDSCCKVLYKQTQTGRWMMFPKSDNSNGNYVYLKHIFTPSFMGFIFHKNMSFILKFYGTIQLFLMPMS